MDLPGFNKEFVDFPDYIIRITDRIWHQRKVDLCLDYYSQDCMIHTLAGEVRGADTVVANTHATMAAFPDRRLEADNVIWSDDGPDGFYSSHLITSLMTNLGPSEFGPATGKRVRILTIADCACRDNRIYEEWLVRDNLGLVLQLGLDPASIVAVQVDRDESEGFSLIDFHQVDFEAVAKCEPVQQEIPSNWASNPQVYAAGILVAIWSPTFETAVVAHYDFRAKGYYPGDRSLYGPKDFTEFLTSVREAFSDLQIRVEHTASVPYLDGGWDVAIRWSLAGRHTGHGRYGEPTGALVYILGATQYRLISGQVHADWTVWDDLAVMRQIETARRHK
jgi:predicted ester cyclase